MIRDSIAAVGLDCDATRMLQHDLAAVYRLQNRTVEAAKLFQEVVDWRTQHLGRDHSLTLVSRAGLASSLAALGRYYDAETI